MIINPYEFKRARIVGITRESAKAVTVYVKTAKTYTFSIGQHAVVRVTTPDGLMLLRQYSFSAPENGNHVQFTIAEEPGGAVSSWFNRVAKVGDNIEISQPFTGPLVQNVPRGDICIIAGGSGIAPLMGWIQMLRSQSRPFTLFYSTRTDIRCFQRELVAQAQETITVRTTDTKPRFTSEEIMTHLHSSSTVLLCGSREFVIAMRAVCEKIVPIDPIHSEAFTL